MKRAYYMNDGMFCTEHCVINRRETRFNRQTWLVWDYGWL